MQALFLQSYVNEQLELHACEKLSGNPKSDMKTLKVHAKAI